MGEDREEILRRHAEAAEIELGDALSDASTEDARRMGWITRTRVWLKVLPSIVNRTELRAHECRGSLFLS